MALKSVAMMVMKRADQKEWKWVALLVYMLADQLAVSLESKMVEKLVQRMVFHSAYMRVAVKVEHWDIQWVTLLGNCLALMMVVLWAASMVG